MFDRFFSKTLPALALWVGLSTGQANAATLLTVNVTNPNAVVFTTTGAAPLVDASIPAFNGISLMDFFTGGIPFSSPNPLLTSNSLTAGTGMTNVLQAFTYDTTTRLNLFAFGGGTYTFSIAAPAFGGIGSLDLGFISALLPAAGFTGDIVTGDVTLGPVIGSYVVVADTAPVPLPAALPLLGFALGGLAMVRRKRT